MNTVLLPVKGFKDAKRRLSAWLTPDERAGLARAMLEDVLRAIGRATAAERVVVYTAHAEVSAMARKAGFEVVVEREVDGHSAAVNRMVSELDGVASKVLAIASDLPKLSGEEIDLVLNRAIEKLVLIPSRDRTGTNGVVMLKHAKIQMDYGAGSLRRHLARAKAAGLEVDIMQVPGIALDIDTPEDLLLFFKDPNRDTETWKFLAESRIATRIL